MRLLNEVRLDVCCVVGCLQPTCFMLADSFALQYSDPASNLRRHALSEEQRQFYVLAVKEAEAESGTATTLICGGDPALRMLRAG